MIASNYAPHDVWSQKPDESYHPHKGNRNRGQHGCCDHTYNPSAVEIHPQTTGSLIT